MTKLLWIKFWVGELGAVVFTSLGSSTSILPLSFFYGMVGGGFLLYFMFAVQDMLG